MQQLKKLYASLSSGQRLAIVAAVAATVAGMGLLQWRTAASFKPLYTSLSQEDAGAVVQKLKQSGVEYRLAENGTTVLVPDNNVAESRLEMAMAGLPKTGRIGFEIFDRTNLGVTEFAEHINYQRALEGELERSVMSLTEVEQARVHVTFPKTSVFSESREPAKASVLLRIRLGSQLSDRNVAAISHLLAAAVEGLDPRAVSVLDMHGNLLSRARGNSPGDFEEASDSMVEYKQSLEGNLVSKIRETLEPLLGHDKFRAGVSIDCDFTSGERSEESYDPTQSVMLSSQTSEEGTRPGTTTTGIPGTASALPRPRAEGTTVDTGSFRRSENVSYQTARTVQRTKIPQGVVKKISAAVLVDYAVRWEGEGEEQKPVLTAPTPEKLEVIRELVAAAIGLDAARGDQLTVQTLPFESTLQLEKSPFASPAPQATELQPLDQLQEQFKQNPMLFVGIALAAVLLLGLGAWAIGRAQKRKRIVAEEARQRALPAAEAQASGGNLGPGGHRLAGLPAAAGQGSASFYSPASSHDPQLVQAVREVVVKDAELSAGIVQGWLLEGEKR